MAAHLTPKLGLPYPDPNDNVDVPRDIQALAMALDNGATFIVGEVRHLAVQAAPQGWLLADGATVSRTTYSKLFAATGVAFGVGDGSTTFGLPDLKGRAIVGSGTGAGLTGRAIGEKFGAEAMTVAQMPSHNHGGATGTGTTGGGTTGTGATGAGVSSYVSGADYGTLNHIHAINLGAAGMSLVAATGSTGGNWVTGGGPLGNPDRNLDNHTHNVPSLSIPGLSVPGLAVPALAIAAQGGGTGHWQPSIAIPAYIYAGQ